MHGDVPGATGRHLPLPPPPPPSRSTTSQASRPHLLQVSSGCARCTSTTRRREVEPKRRGAAGGAGGARRADAAAEQARPAEGGGGQDRRAEGRRGGREEGGARAEGRGRLRQDHRRPRAAAAKQLEGDGRLAGRAAHQRSWATCCVARRRSRTSGRSPPTTAPTCGDVARRWLAAEGAAHRGRDGKILGRPGAAARLADHGLPADAFSSENGIILSHSRRWPLLHRPADPGEQVHQEHGGGGAAEGGEAERPRTLRTLENAVRFGKPVVMENVLEALDPALEPVL